MFSGRSSYVDLHCHLDLFKEPVAAVAKTSAAGVYTLCVTTTPRAWRGTTKLVAGHQRIRVALGLHPEVAHTRVGELPLFEALLPEAPYVGEVGLDGLPEQRAHQAVQMRVFDTVLTLAARSGGRIVSIHSRRAVSAVLDALERHKGCGTPILHWFTGSQGELARAVRLGCHFSVGPGMIRSASGLARIKAIPADRLLTETDGPFGPKGSDGPAGPWDIPQFVKQIANVRGMAPDDLHYLIAENFRLLVASAVK